MQLRNQMRKLESILRADPDQANVVPQGRFCITVRRRGCVREIEAMPPTDTAAPAMLAIKDRDENITCEGSEGAVYDPTWDPNF